MRIAIIGTSGAGKTTLAIALAKALKLQRIEIDAINWQADWRDLNSHDPAEFLRRTRAAVGGEAWICDGNYSVVRPAVLAKATDLIWLDYSRALIMARVIRRSIKRATDRRELWPGTGNRESWRRWLDADHPIRWAWETWARRRLDYEVMIRSPDIAHLRIFRLIGPGQTPGLIETLKSEQALKAASDFSK